MNSNSNRKLAAIMFCDIQGYTALMQSNEQLALFSLQKFKTQLDTQVPQHNGEIINFYGDGCLAIFNSSVDATACAKSLQLRFQKEPKVPVRIGLHAGDVVLRDDNVFGDAVNIASRIESMGVAGSVLLSSTVRNQIKNQESFHVSALGKFEFKNVEGEMTVYALTNEGLVVPKKESLKGKQKTTTKKRNWTILIGMLGLTLLAFLGYNYFGSNANPIPLSENNGITIFPFEVKGSQDLQYLGEGVVDLISTQLDDITAISAIDPNLVFNELKEKENAQPALVEAISMSRDFGAGRFVLGNIIVLNDQLEVTASKYDVKGQLLSKKNVKGQSNDLTQMVDELIRVLIADELDLEGMELAGTAAMTSQSLPALQEYLLGEQDFRKVKFTEAVEHYSKAIKIDSSFALAWMRISDAEGWMVERAHPQALQKANQYKDRLPEKWREYIAVVAKRFPNSLEKIKAYEQLQLDYGETAVVTEKLADRVFHYVPAYGRSPFEAKPLLQKALELNPNNLEASLHLMQMATVERDSVTMQAIMENTDEEADFWLVNQIQMLTLKDKYSEAEMLEIINHPKFENFYFDFVCVASEDALVYSNQLMQFEPYLKDGIAKSILFWNNYALKGQEKEAFKIAEQLMSELNARKDGQAIYLTSNYENLFAMLVANEEYQPLAEAYETFFNRIKDKPDLSAQYAAWKYAVLLQKTQEAKRLKTALKEKVATNPGPSGYQAKFYYYSMLAFEARSQKDNNTALKWIDSTYQYSPGGWLTHISYLDKQFMLADIYEEQGEYAKAIPYLEHYPVLRNFAFTRGYANYRLTQLYELNGDIDKAFAKCNLFLKDYAECDEKYRPWVEEVKERRDRLMAKEL